MRNCIGLIGALAVTKFVLAFPFAVRSGIFKDICQNI